MSHTTVAEPNRHPAPITTSHANNAPKQWTTTTHEGLKISGYQPPWALEDPSRGGVRLDELCFVLRDILHWTTFPGVPLLTFAFPAQHHATATRPGTIELDETIFTSTIECRPYAEHSHERVPTADFHLTENCWMNGLDATALPHLAAQLRNQADRLDHEVRPALITARIDWATHHPLANHAVAAPPGGAP